MDGGIRQGEDIFKALALGAKMVNNRITIMTSINQNSMSSILIDNSRYYQNRLLINNYL